PVSCFNQLSLFGGWRAMGLLPPVSSLAIDMASLQGFDSNLFQRTCLYAILTSKHWQFKSGADALKIV
ncbi:hypothetical protein, partial [Rhodohalobacter sp.]|uniref:hypothetical protein n=1 Tax=Rhodohalobacter sp. TaxID=1974210 RepID=UPI003563D7A8